MFRSSHSDDAHSDDAQFMRLVSQNLSLFVRFIRQIWLYDFTRSGYLANTP